MVKFTASTPDGLLVGLGITYENVIRLKQGKPIHIQLADLGLPQGELLIFYGKDEQAITKDLLPYIGEDTILHGTENLEREGGR